MRRRDDPGAARPPRAVVRGDESAIGGARRGVFVALASVLSATIAPDALAAIATPPGVHDGTPPRRPLPGVLSERRLEGERQQAYYVYVPRMLRRNAPVVVAVHGISRNAQEHAQRLAPQAERFGAVLVAPLFDETNFPDYQRLGRPERGARADRMLERIVDEVGRMTGADVRSLYLFGFSGGGQFVHRYAMANPERVASYVIGAAGWYTFPDASIPFPRGTRAAHCFDDVCFEPQRYLRVPALVLVGERDIHEGTALRRSARLDAQQGETRLERGENWVEAMRTAARHEGYDTPFEFAVLPRSGHSFTRSADRGRIGERIFDWFFRADRGSRPPAAAAAAPVASRGARSAASLAASPA